MKAKNPGVLHVSSGESELELLYRTAPVGLCLMDAELRFVSINERLASINGRPVAEHIGRTLREVIPEIADVTEPIYREVIETGESALNFEVEGATPANPDQKMCCLVSYHPLKGSDGRVTGVSTVVQDISYRKRVEGDLRKSQERYRVLLESTSAVPWEADPATWRFTYVGPQAVELLGYPLEAWYEEGFWTGHIHPDDVDQAMNYCHAASQAQRQYEFDYRMMAADGRVVWLHDIVSVETCDGKPKTLRGFLIDISGRKLAEGELLESELALRKSRGELRQLTARMFAAQEEERRRVARELHDDLSQRLAALAIDTGKLAADGQMPSQVLGRVREMEQRIHELSLSIHSISRQLHPSIIEDLGLVSAIESECASTGQWEDMNVRFESRDVPQELTHDVALCLYRITQESLRNIAKHADTKEAYVSLVGVDDGLFLTVRDRGTGFDFSTAQGRMGLGLGSMEERVRLIDGSISITSAPGQGTTVEVHAPCGQGAS